MSSQSFSLEEKLDLLERYHLPIYLGKKYKRLYKVNTDVDFLINPEASTEIQIVYQEAFEKTKNASTRALILKSYVSNFPDLAWDRVGWFWHLWNRLRGGKDKNGDLLLKAIGDGVSLPIAKLGKFQKQRKIEKARKMYRKMMNEADPNYSKSIGCLLYGMRGHSEARKKEIFQTIIEPLEEQIKKFNSRLTIADIEKKLVKEPPAHAVRMIVADICNVREADLAAKSPLD